MRQPQPWRRSASGAWYAWVQGRQVKLAPASAPKETAWKALRSLQSGAEPLTVPSTTATVGSLLAGFQADQEARHAAGRPWIRATWGRRMRELRERLGLPRGMVVYSFRAAFFTDGLVAGVSPAVMAELVGHKSLAMLRHYSRLAQRRETLREAVNVIRGEGKDKPSGE